MRKKLNILASVVVSLLSLFVPYAHVSAGNVTATETCNVQVYFTATVPDSVEQGKSLTISNITVQPANSYGFTVTSSTLTMAATNTTSSTYSQSSYATNPSPTTGHNTYVAMYPNWILDASGSAGSSIAIQLKKSVTVIQGYGGSPVTCTFSKVLATIPITAKSVSSSPSPSPSSTPSATPTTPSTTSGSSSSSSSPSGSSFGVSTSVSGTSQTASSSTKSSSSSSSAAAAPDTSGQPVNQSVSVVPLTIEVNDSSGKSVSGAEVILDGSKKLTTNGDGKVTFSNVLTGTHVILASYNGQRVTKSITLSATNVGTATAINLPKVPFAKEDIIAIAVAAGAVVIGGVGSLLLRRKRASAASQQTTSNMSLHGIISGSAVALQPAATMRHIPSIPVFAPQSTTPNPAPWAPPAAVQQESAINESAAPIATLEAQTIQHFSQAPATLPVEQAQAPSLPDTPVAEVLDTEALPSVSPVPRDRVS